MSVSAVISIAPYRKCPILAIFALIICVTSPQFLQGMQEELSIDLGEGVKCEFRWQEAGEFLQGSPENEKGREEDEKQFKVQLRQGFFIGKYPITIGQYRRFVVETKYRTEAEKGKSGGYGFDGTRVVQSTEYSWSHPGYPITDQHPVTIVTLGDAIAFCRWLSMKSGRKVDLPTEAQWEYACRSGTTTRSYAGEDDSDIDRIAWHKQNSSSGPQPVGLKAPNASGLYDMCGNVNEWCLDLYNIYPGEAVDPLQKAGIEGEKVRNVLRGGSWLRDRRRSRSASRYQSDPMSRNPDIGFRIVVTSTLNSPQGVAEVGASTEAFPSLPETSEEPNSLQPHASTVESPTRSTPAISWLGILACFGISLLAVPILVFALLRAVFSSPIRKENIQPLAATPSGFPSTIQDLIQIESNGFWFNTSSLSLGTKVYYQFWVLSQAHQAIFEVENSYRQFIYTGSQPTSVDILDTVEPENDEELEIYPMEEDENVGEDQEVEGEESSSEDENHSKTPPILAESQYQEMTDHSSSRDSTDRSVPDRHYPSAY